MKVAQVAVIVRTITNSKLNIIFVNLIYQLIRKYFKGGNKRIINYILNIKISQLEIIKQENETYLK